MNVQAIFALFVEARLGYECPAVQDAIDRLVASECLRTRGNMLEVLRSSNYDGVAFNASLLSAWKSEDVKLATSHPVDWWIELANRLEGQRITLDYDPPPIPDRRHDWTAVTDNYEPEHPLGRGLTAIAAINDWLMEAELKS